MHSQRWSAALTVVAVVAGGRGDLWAGDAAAVRAVIERSGGSLRLGAQGEPVEIDWTAGRGSVDGAAFNAILACPTLQALRMRAGSIPPEQLVRIGSLASLRELALQDVLLDDQSLLALAAPLRGLQRLTLRNASRVTDDGMASLVRRLPLTHLTLIEMQVTDRALLAIAAAPGLVLLDLRQCNRVTSQGLGQLSQATALRELRLGGAGIDDDAAAAMASILRLERLSIEDAPLGAAGLDRLTANPELAHRLRQVALSRCQGIDDAALEPLGRLSRLRQLSLRDMPVKGTFLRCLAAPEALESLSLNETYLTEVAVASLNRCRQLKRLELAQVPVGAEAMRMIGTLSHLEYLNLADFLPSPEATGYSARDVIAHLLTGVETTRLAVT